LSSAVEPNTIQAYGLTILRNAHKDIRRLRRQTGSATLHGNKFWKSTFVLMDYLKELDLPKGVRILEVGCGWGLGGIYCAKAFDAQVTALDADPSVFEYLRHHADINGVEVDTWHSRFEKVTKAHLGEYDLVIAADVCFWNEIVDPLFNLIRRARQAGVAHVVVTDPGRPTFRALAERCLDKLGAEYTDWVVPAPHNSWGLVLDVCDLQAE